jgi:hypothetical protein
MIHINSYKLTPAITATWGDITGNVSNQEDLVEYINEHGTAAWGSISGNISDQSDLMSTLGSYATESWVSSQQFATESWVSEQGFLTSVPSEYATQSWVSEQGYLTSTALTGYATESWVSEQGYLTSVPSEYATQSWVSEQGFLTEHQSLKTVNNQSLVGEGNIEITGSLTPEQEAVIAPLLDRSTGVLTADVKTKYKYVGFAEAPSSDYKGEVWVYDINNNVYMINWMNLENNNTTPYIYKWNSDSWKFELFTYNGVPVNIVGDVPVITAVTDNHVIWCDSQGRYYFNNTHTITFTDKEWVFTEKTMGGQLQTYNGLKSNIIKDANTGLEGVWMYYAQKGSTGTVYKFNEETQEFESQEGIFYYPRTTDFYKYGFYYNGRYCFTYPNKQSLGNKLYTIIKSSIPGRAAESSVEAWEIPSFADVQNEDGTTKRVYVTGERIRTIVKDGETKYILYYGPNAWMLNTESTPYTWDYLDLVRKDTYSYYANGVEAGDLMFGFGGNDEVTGQVIVWNFSDKVIEDYGWDNSLDERLAYVEKIAPSAEVLTKASNGVLYTDEIEGNKLNYKNWFGNLFQPNRLYSMFDGSVYYFEYPALYKLNSETMNFEFIVNVSSNNGLPLWMDNRGRMFQGSDSEINLKTGSVTSVNLYYDYFTYNRNRCNLFYGDTAIWMVSSNNTVKKYNELNSKFSGNYSITLPQDYIGDIAYDICNVFTYKGHKLFFTTDNKTYEVVDAILAVRDVTGVYFPMPTFNYNPYFFFTTEDGNLWYMNSYDKYVYTGTTWETPTITLDNYSFNNNYVVSGNCVFGGVYQPDSKYTVLNLGQTLKNTYWTPVNSVAVDIDSSQHILGSKTFDNINTQSSGINHVYAPNGSTNIDLGKNNTNASKMEFTVPGMFTLNGENIATTDKCFVNRSYTTSGPMYEGICPTTITSYYNYFKTPSGRLIYDDGTVAYEFDGTQFTQLQTVTVHPQINTFVTITDGLFAKDNSGNLIKWNDTTSDWEVLIDLIEPESIIWTADANTLRNGPKYKLDNTGGTYSWVADSIVDYPYICHTYFIGQNVYMMQEGGNMVYQYDESTKTFTFIGNTNNWPNNSHWFVFENGLYYFGDDGNVHKIDPSQAGTDQWDVVTNILYTGWDCLYIEYNNKLYLTNSNVTNSFGYCYDITETAPAVPSTNGTYVLKAVRSGDQVTFSWVPEA